MMLARIQPGPERYSEVWTFECPKCDYVVEQLALDPMKTDKVAWLKGGLNPPH
jgi:hypothetical protein